MFWRQICLPSHSEVNHACCKCFQVFLSVSASLRLKHLYLAEPFLIFTVLWNKKILVSTDFLSCTSAQFMFTWLKWINYCFSKCNNFKPRMSYITQRCNKTTVNIHTCSHLSTFLLLVLCLNPMFLYLVLVYLGSSHVCVSPLHCR